MACLLHLETKILRHGKLVNISRSAHSAEEPGCQPACFASEELQLSSKAEPGRSSTSAGSSRTTFALGLCAPAIWASCSHQGEGQKSKHRPFWGHTSENVTDQTPGELSSAGCISQGLGQLGECSSGPGRPQNPLPLPLSPGL